MKYPIATLILFAATLQAQPVLKFDKPFIESEDQSVVLQKGKDSIYTSALSA